MNIQQKVDDLKEEIATHTKIIETSTATRKALNTALKAYEKILAAAKEVEANSPAIEK